jgi:hypothetical protein
MGSRTDSPDYILVCVQRARSPPCLLATTNRATDTLLLLSSCAWCTQGASMASLRAWAADAKAKQRVGAGALVGCSPGDSNAWQDLLGGGRPARQDHSEGHSAYGTLYCTGHEVMGECVHGGITASGASKHKTRRAGWRLQDANLHTLTWTVTVHLRGYSVLVKAAVCVRELTTASTHNSCLSCTNVCRPQDGGVRLWDMQAQAPQLLGCAPSPEAAAALSVRAAARPVSTLECAWEQGLLITGHEGGEVRRLATRLA